jgi:hypothetical protein
LGRAAHRSKHPPRRRMTMGRTIRAAVLSGVLGMSVAAWGSIVAAGEPPAAAELLGKLTTEEVEPGVF